MDNKAIQSRRLLDQIAATYYLYSKRGVLSDKGNERLNQLKNEFISNEHRTPLIYSKILLEGIDSSVDDFFDYQGLRDKQIYSETRELYKLEALNLVKDYEEHELAKQSLLEQYKDLGYSLQDTSITYTFENATNESLNKASEKFKSNLLDANLGVVDQSVDVRTHPESNQITVDFSSRYSVEVMNVLGIKPENINDNLSVSPKKDGECIPGMGSVEDYKQYLVRRKEMQSKHCELSTLAS